MKKALIWCALAIGGLWLVWAMIGEAPGELKPNATVRETPTKQPVNVVLCQDALQRRQAFLGAENASWAGRSSKELRTDLILMEMLQSKDLAMQRFGAFLLAVADLNDEVESYCGQ